MRSRPDLWASESVRKKWEELVQDAMQGCQCSLAPLRINSLAGTRRRFSCQEFVAVSRVIVSSEFPVPANTLKQLAKLFAEFRLVEFGPDRGKGLSLVLGVNILAGNETIQCVSQLPIIFGL